MKTRMPVAQVFELAGETYAVISYGAPRVGVLSELSAAEREIVGFVVEGLDTNAIAARRGRAPRTVANQLASIYRKLGISGRSELVLLVMQRGSAELSASMRRTAVAVEAHAPERATK